MPQESNMATYLGIDIGTSGTKAILLSENGTVLATNTQEYSLSTPKPQWAEQSPDQQWGPAAIESIKGVCATAGISPNTIDAVGLTGQMHGSVFLDASDNVIRPALLWCDARTSDECTEITAAAGGQKGLFDLLGQNIVASFTLPKVLWLRKHEPENFARLTTVLLPKDYIRFLLTGNKHSEISDASGTGILDVRNRTWSKPLAAALDIDLALFPPLIESPEIAGHITADASATTGLREGIPVVAGAGDQPAGAVGAGVVGPGQVMLSLGTSAVVWAHAATPAIDPELRIGTFCSAVPGEWGLMGCMLSGGGALRWYRDTFQPAAGYTEITSGAATAPAGCEGLIFLPYLTGERTPYADPDARGVFFGATLRTTQDWFARAVLEGVAYSVNDATALLTTLDVPISEVRAIGGGAKSTIWLQIMADVTNQKHVLPTLDEGPAAGAAILAAVGAGTFANVKDACAALVGTTPAAVPGPDASLYAKWAPHYQALYPALQASFKAVARTAAGA